MTSVSPEKTQMKASVVKSFHSLYGESVVHPDPEKEEAIYAMTGPRDSLMAPGISMHGHISQPFHPRPINLDSLPEKRDIDLTWKQTYNAAF